MWFWRFIVYTSLIYVNSTICRKGRTFVCIDGATNTASACEVAQAQDPKNGQCKPTVPFTTIPSVLGLISKRTVSEQVAVNWSFLWHSWNTYRDIIVSKLLNPHLNRWGSSRIIDKRNVETYLKRSKTWQ